MDRYVEIHNHLGEIKFDPNEPLPPSVDTHLYLRVCNYGAKVVSLFEYWYEEGFLKVIKFLFKPQAFTSLARAYFVQQFQ